MTRLEAEDTSSDLPVIDYVGTLSVQETKGDADPFSVNVSEIKEFNISPAAKRRLTRIQKAYTGEGEAKSRQTELGYYSAYDLFEVVVPPHNLDYLASIYSLSAANYASCNAKTSNIVGLGYSWVETPQTLAKIEGTKPEALDKIRGKLNRIKIALDQKLEDCNAEDTFEEVLQKVWTDYESTGNGYIEVGRKRDGQIGYIGHIPSRTMRVRRSRDGFVQIVGKHYTFFRNFGDQKTKDPISTETQINEIIHIKKYAPSTTFYGVPDIVAAASSVAGDEFASRFNLDYFEHKAVPRYVITVKGASLSAGAEKNLLEFFETSLKGKNHRTLYVPLPADNVNSKVEFSMEKVEADIQDSSFSNYRTANRDEILMVHRVPITKIGVAEGVALAVAKDADKTFKEQVCQPEQKRLEKKLNMIIAEFTDVFKIKLNELSLTDEETQSMILERLLRNQALTINEGRAEIGRAPHPEGDKFLDLNAQKKAEMASEARGNDSRARERANSSSQNESAGRNPKGEGARSS